MLRPSTKTSQRNAARTAQRTTVDQWFDRVGQASQVLLLVLGVFGYFYTVLPLYEKALLDEEIAKKTLELNKASADLAKTSLDLQAKEGELQRLATMTEQKTRELERKEDELAKTSSSMRQAQHVATMAKMQAETATFDAEVNYISYRREFLVGVEQRIRACWVRRMFAGPVGKEWQLCTNNLNHLAKTIAVQLKHGDGPRLERAIREAFDSREPEFNAFMTLANERRTAINSENAALAAQSKAADAVPYTSRDRKADADRIARSSELFKETLDVENRAAEQMHKLLGGAAAQVTKDMWPFKAGQR